MLLQIKGLTAHYDKVIALRDISLEVGEGEIVTLIGANGAGKSTTLMCISGIKHPTSGEIWFKGERVDRKPPDEVVRRGVVQVPEGRRVFHEMTVLENLLLGAYTKKGRSEIEAHLIEIYDHFPILGERKGQMAGSLSGGEQQMLAMARALMARRELLLMDEPSLGVAPMVVQEIAQIISDINRSGISIMLVEQNAHMALSLAHRGYVLEVGEVTLQDNAKALLENEGVKQAYLGL